MQTILEKHPLQRILRLDSFYNAEREHLYVY